MKTGIGIRPELFAVVQENKPAVGFFEAHSENYFGESIARAKLLQLREDYPVSLHGVGLSLGRADNLDQQHLQHLKQLVNEVDPLFVSEHLAWSAYAHQHVPDLLPLPLTAQALGIMCEHVQQLQEAVQRTVLVENPSNYLLFDELVISEPEFLNELAKRTGCKLLLDVNNVAVSSHNCGRNALQYVQQIDSQSIAQYHLAGYTPVERDGETVLIDTHNHTIYPEVWDLYKQTIEYHGVRPSLVEWDSDFPEFDVLLSECAKADAICTEVLKHNSISDEKLIPEAKPLADNKPLVDKEPLASKEPLADKKPLANKKPLADKEPLASKELVKYQTTFLQDILKQSTDHDQTARFWIYQNNVYAALHDYLSEVYPALSGVVGEDFFAQTVKQFIQTTPPHKGNLHLYGEEFIEFIGQLEALRGLVYLTDLARYEWALHTAYYSKVSDSIDPQTVEQSELLELPVNFNASVHLVESTFPLLEIHRQSLPGYQQAVNIDLSQSQDSVLVYKQHYAVKTQTMNQAQLLLYKAVDQNGSLLQAIEHVQNELDAQSLSVALGWLLEARLLTRKTHS